jgi:15-cis-phytoene desaturase
MKALVMGGGMAGLATAINLLDLGIEVELIESDEMFGGRASSWLDEDGDMIDNALHVFFPYYVNLINFFKKMGIYENIAWKSTEFHYAMDNGETAVMKFAKLPAPFHAAAAFVSLIKAYNGIPKWKMLFTAASLGTAVLFSKEKIDSLDDMTLAQYNARRGPHDAMKPLEPGINGLTFTPSWMISAKVMVNWFKKVGASYETSRVGFANGGLGEIWVGNCLDYIAKKGGKVELNQSVTAINVEDGKIKSVTVNGTDERTADLYISAMSPYSLRKVLPDESYYFDYFKDLMHFTYAPSMSLQVWFDRKLTDVDVTFFSNDCIFNTYADLSNVLPHIFKGGTMFEMVLSPADHLEGLPDEVIYDTAINDIKRLFPVAREAEVKKWKVVRERQGVYRAYPGMEKHRPFQRSPYDNLYLTGDYTKTHVSSGGMEAAIWNSNKVAELVAQDKLGKTIDLNEEFNADRGFTPVLRVLNQLAPAIIGALVLGAIVKKIIRKKG